MTTQADDDVHSDVKNNVNNLMAVNDVVMATGRQVVVVVGNSSAAAAVAARGAFDHTGDEDAATKAGHLRADSYEWIYTAWSECSASCGRGT